MRIYYVISYVRYRNKRLTLNIVMENIMLRGHNIASFLPKYLFNLFPVEFIFYIKLCGVGLILVNYCFNCVSGSKIFFYCLRLREYDAH